MTYRVRLPQACLSLRWLVAGLVLAAGLVSCHREELPTTFLSESEPTRFSAEESAGPGQPPAFRDEPLPEAIPFVNEPGQAVELILVGDRIPAHTCLAAPVASRLGTAKSGIPQTTTVSNDAGLAASNRQFVERYAPARVLILAVEGDWSAANVTGSAPAYTLRLPSDLSAASLMLARRFWGTSRQAVFCGPSPGELIAGSALAARRRQPLIVLASGEEVTGLQEAATQLKIAGGVLVSQSQPAAWLSGAPFAISTMTCREAEGALAASFAAGRVRNIILTRQPDSEMEVGGSAWLGPYASLVRGAPLVSVASGDASAAEEAVHQLIRSRGLRPRSVTILGCEESIGLKEVTIALPAPAPLPDSEETGEVVENGEGMIVHVEPFTVPSDNEALSLAVGRIPFPDLAPASTFLSRTFARQRLLQSTPAQVLMVANPSPEYGNLPLCETISRATALEVKNLRLRLRQFYGEASHNAEIREAVGESTLVIYEGHLGDQRLFEDPSFFMEQSEDYEGYRPDLEGVSPDGGYGMADAEDSPGDAVQPEDGPVVSDPDPEEPPLDSPMVPLAGGQDLRGLPFVILQSCQSLSADLFNLLNERGGTALVGSTTNIHSASGSTFIKAMMDAVLYREATVGEALRDARNYYLCLQDLKTARGHREQAKSLRVALSFRLWGDPEAKMFTRGLPTPTRPLVEASWRSADVLELQFPEKHLPSVRTPKYLFRIFPGCEAAGIVKRSGKSQRRRILPIHFLRLDLPEGFAHGRFRRLEVVGGQPNRAVFRTDPLSGTLCVLYFPDKERPNERVSLRFEQ